MEKSLRKLEDSLRKYDKSYHDACQQAEQARQEWDSTIYKVPTIDWVTPRAMA